MVKGGKNTRLLSIVSFLTISLFAVSNLPWTLDDYDQAKQAFVSYQMIGQQRWLYQTTPHEGMTGNPNVIPFIISTVNHRRSPGFLRGFMKLAAHGISRGVSLPSLPRSRSHFWFFAALELLVICLR